jgi:hypothetical protein
MRQGCQKHVTGRQSEEQNRTPNQTGKHPTPTFRTESRRRASQPRRNAAPDDALSQFGKAPAPDRLLVRGSGPPDNKHESGF